MASNLTACATNGSLIVLPNGVMEELGAQAEAARQGDSPGGTTVTQAERDAMETHARTRLQSLYNDIAGRLDALRPLSGALQACRNNVGVGLRNVDAQARGMVDVTLQPPSDAPAAPPAPSQPRSPGPLAPRGTVYDI